MANKDLLIVDDEPLVCESLKEMLTMEGYRVDAALNGQAALEKLQDRPVPAGPLGYSDARPERHRIVKRVERPQP